jgi:hypothetical protein
LQIAIAYLGQHIEIEAVIGKHASVAFETQAFEPPCDS